MQVGSIEIKLSPFLGIELFYVICFIDGLFYVLSGINELRCAKFHFLKKQYLICAKTKSCR